MSPCRACRLSLCIPVARRRDGDIPVSFCVSITGLHREKVPGESRRRVLVIPLPHAIFIGKNRGAGQQETRDCDSEGLPVSRVHARELVHVSPSPCPWFQRKPCDKSMIASETWRQMGWSFHEALTEKSRDRGRLPVITGATGRRFIRQEKVYKADGEGFLPLFLFRSCLLSTSPLTSSVFTLLQLSLVLNIPLSFQNGQAHLRLHRPRLRCLQLHGLSRRH
jgi:hypothetical protein